MLGYEATSKISRDTSFGVEATRRTQFPLGISYYIGKSLGRARILLKYLSTFVLYGQGKYESLSFRFSS